LVENYPGRIDVSCLAAFLIFQMIELCVLDVAEIILQGEVGELYPAISGE